MARKGETWFPTAVVGPKKQWPRLVRGWDRPAQPLPRPPAPGYGKNRHSCGPHVALEAPCVPPLGRARCHPPTSSGRKRAVARVCLVTADPKAKAWGPVQTGGAGPQVASLGVAEEAEDAQKGLQRAHA